MIYISTYIVWLELDIEYNDAVYHPGSTVKLVKVINVGNSGTNEIQVKKKFYNVKFLLKW